MLKTQPPPHIIFTYYMMMLPLILLRVAPLSLLIAVLYSFGELNKSNELVSMRSSGISIIKICLPVIFFAAFNSFALFYVQEKMLMKSQEKVEDIRIRFIKSGSSGGEQQNFAFPYNNMIFFARTFAPKQGILKDVTIFEEDEKGNIAAKVTCSELIYQPTCWKEYGVMEYSLDKEGNIVGKPNESKVRDSHLVGTPQEIMAKRTVFAQFASLKMIKKEMKQLKRIGSQKLLTERIITYHEKLSTPFASLFLIIAALPFATEIKKRRVTLSSLSTGFIFGCAFYCLNGVFIALAKNGTLLPVFGAWLAPLFFLVVGIMGLILIK
jgi:lipopolysaccharide export system permease protein